MNLLACILLALLSPFIVLAVIASTMLIICLVCLLLAIIYSPFALVATGIQNIWHKIKK